MIAQLTSSERQYAAMILLVVAMAGIAMAALGKSDPLGIHGVIVLLYSGILLYFVVRAFYRPEPQIDREASYYDDPIKVGIVLTMAWAVFGMFMGVWVAAQLAWPDLAFDAGWSTFGRLRPTHTTGVIFGFGGNALIATSFHVVQRTSRARLAGQFSPWFVLLGYNLFCLLAVTGYFMGVTQSKEYAEAEWYADLWLVVVWVTYFVLFFRTLARRKEPHIYVANWYYMAFILVVAILHIVNNLAVPVSLRHAKSYTHLARRAGCDGAVVVRPQRRRLLPHRRLPGMLYYYLPVRAQRPIFSYRLSILSFWGITFFYMWAGLAPPALHRAAALGAEPRHDVLGDAAGAVLGLGRQCAADPQRRLAQGPRRRDPALHDGGRGLLRPVDLRGLVPGDPSGQLAFPLHRLDRRPCACRGARLGRADHLRRRSTRWFPSLWKRERMYSPRLVEVHFWLAIAGTLIYVFAMWNSGIIQGLMWRTYTRGRARWPIRSSNSLVAMYPYYIARAFGGLLFLLGAIVACLQHLDDGPRRAATAGRRPADRAGPALAARRRSRPRRSEIMAELFHRKIERTAIGFVIAIIAAASVGGIVEIAPLFTIHETVEDAPDMRALHAAGAGWPQHLRPRRLLRLPQPDDPHLARRGRALRPVLARRRIQIRPPDAVGLEAHRPGPGPHRRQVLRCLACRAPHQSARRRAGIQHAGLSMARPHCRCRPTISGCIWRRSARSACLIPTR